MIRFSLFIFSLSLSVNLFSSDISSERGMTNLLGSDTWARCAAEMSKDNSKVYELSYERTSTMPLSPFAGEYKPKFLPELGFVNSNHIYTMDVLNENVNDGNQGTQIDALGHFGHSDKFWDGKGEVDLSGVRYFKGLTAKEVKPFPEAPLQKLGIETVPPIITTAVLLDVRKHSFGGRSMKAGEYVTVKHIKETLEKSSLNKRGILPGDIVLIYTGWSDQYEDPDENKIYYSKAPGISFNAAKFLATKKVVGVGVDNWGVDAFGDPSEMGKEVSQNPDGVVLPAHYYFLTQVGIHTIENLKLDLLAKDSVDLSCVMILPLKTKGSAASPIRPVAIGSSKS